jgi:hypothetical protein
MAGARTDATPGRLGDRAQSVFDYTIGVSIFVVVVIAVFAFVPTAFGSFGGSAADAESNGLAADRAADHLTGTILSESGSGAGVATDCALLFFSGDPGHPDIDEGRGDCELESARSGSLTQTLSLSATTGANVTIEMPFVTGGGVACWDTDGGVVVGTDDPDCGDQPRDVVFSAGPSAADNPGFATAERYGVLSGSRIHVTVRVW